jgi:hypothetical protein
MNNYEEKALQLDMQLATTIGYTDVKESKLYKHRIAGKLKGEHQTIARWTQGDGDAFRLAVEYSIEVMFPIPDEMQVNYTKDYKGCVLCFRYKNFPDKQSAVRFAIVQAVINKLKGA